MNHGAWAGGPDISIPGICQHLPLTGKVGGHEAMVTTAGGRIHPETDLVLGETLAHGAITVECDNPAFWDDVAEQAQRKASFLRAQQGGAAA